MIMVMVAVIFIIIMLLLLLMMMIIISQHEIHTGRTVLLFLRYFLTERSCAVQISKVECHGISDRCSYYNE